LSVAGTNPASIGFSDVPASDPRMPLLANAARTPVVSSIDSPAVLAPAAAWDNDNPMSSTLLVEALAAPARAAATVPA